MARWSYSRRIALAAASGALALATPAYAAPSGAPALALVAAQVGSCVAISDLSAIPTSTQALKSEAILDGAPSALERIRMMQAAPAVIGAGLTLADAASQAESCHVATVSPQQAVQLASPAHSPVTAQIAGRPSDFLASSRIPIAHTRFDADWARVSAKHLSARSIEQSMGSPASDKLALIGQVNRWANGRIAYRADSPRYHGGDYWADAVQTLRSGRGDCEDIAIVKYQALLSLGIAPSDMYLTIAHDLVRHADHALLVVRHEGRFYVLDDSTDALLDGSDANEYRPILSFGEGKWLHGLPAPSQPVIYLSRNELSSPRVMGVVR